MKKKIYLVVSLLFIFMCLNSCSSLNSSSSRNNENIESVQILGELSLPNEPISTDDIPDFQKKIQMALAIISYDIKKTQLEYLKTKFRNQPADKLPEYNPSIAGLLQFENWLNQQGCILSVDMPLVGNKEQRAAKILTSYPGQVKIIIHFISRNDLVNEYRLTLFVKTDSLTLANFDKNI